MTQPAHPTPCSYLFFAGSVLPDHLPYSGGSRQALFRAVQEWSDPEFQVCAACALPLSVVGVSLSAGPRRPPVRWGPHALPCSPDVCSCHVLLHPVQMTEGGAGGDYETLLRTSKFCFAPLGFGYGALMC